MRETAFFPEAKSGVVRVLIINYEFPPLGGGAATATRNLARSLARLDCSVTVMTSAFGDLPRREEMDGFVVQRIPVWRRRQDQCSVPEMCTFIASGLFHGYRLLSRRDFDAALAFFTIPCGPIPLFTKWTLGIPYLVSLRGGDVPGAQGAQLAMYHRLCLPATRAIWRHAAFVVANSTGLQELAQKAYPGHEILLIPNGVDTRFFTPGLQKTPPCPGTRLAFVGRLSPEKDLPTLFDALGALPPETAGQWTLDVIGDGPERRRWEQHAARLGLDDRIHFRGWMSREQVRDVYRGVDFFVLPSRDEGMPNVVLEAMASGLPIIASRIRGNVDLVEEDQNGLLFEPGNATELRRALERMIGSPQSRERWGAESRWRAEQRSWDDVAQRYLRLFEEAVQNPHRLRG